MATFVFFYPAFFWLFRPQCCIVQNLTHKYMLNRHVSFLGRWLCNQESRLPSGFLLLPEGLELFCKRSEIKSPLPQKRNVLWLLLQTLTISEHLHSANSACCMSWNHNQLPNNCEGHPEKFLSLHIVMIFLVHAWKHMSCVSCVMCFEITNINQSISTINSGLCVYIVINGTVICCTTYYMEQVCLDSLMNKTKLWAEWHEKLLSRVSTFHTGQPAKQLLPMLHMLNLKVCTCNALMCQTWSFFSFELQTSGDAR